jgi:hypothetical protein
MQDGHIDQAPPPGPAGQSHRRQWSIAAVCLLTVAAACVALTLVSNPDLFWHLAAGKWMLVHHRVLDYDPYSTPPTTRWVNVHWLFQLIVASLHSLGGFAALSLLKAAVAAFTVFAFAWSLRKVVSPGWLMFSGLAMLVVMVGRIRIRPELFSLALMVLVIALLEGVRRGRSRNRLWWLLPIMLAWVNMHGLYVLGLGLIWSSVLGEIIDRRFRRDLPGGRLWSTQAMAPILAATAAVLISPWPIEAAAQPLLLWTRISGQSFYYTYGVSELRPTWQSLGGNVWAVAIAAVAVASLAVDRRRAPAAHFIWLAAMLALAAMALRNVGLSAPVVAYVIAVHGGQAIDDRAARSRLLRRAALPARAAMCLALAALAYGAVTSGLWRWQGWSNRFGAGLQAEHHPIEAARFLKGLAGGGDIFCENFGDASTFIYYSWPERRVFMDGRLEAHTQQRFIEQHRLAGELRTPGAVEKVDLPRDVRFVFVGYNRPRSLALLSRSGRFRLVYIDVAGAVFARTDWHRDMSGLPAPNFGDWDFALDPDAKGRAGPLPHRNPPAIAYQLGATLVSLGQRGQADVDPPDRTQLECMVLAIRYLERAARREEVRTYIATGTLAQACQQRAAQLGLGNVPALPADPNSARALWLYGQLDMTDLDDPEMLMFAQQRIVAMKQASQVERAAEAAVELLDGLPPRLRVSPPTEFLRLRDSQRDMLARCEVDAAERTEGLDTLAQARVLASPSVALVSRAAKAARSLAATDPEAATLLGDLLLRQGLVDQARDAHAGAAKLGAARRDLDLREALCLWVEGNLSAAFEKLRTLASAGEDPLAGCFLAELAVQLGRYDKAREALAGARTDDPHLQAALARIRDAVR